MLYFIRDTDGDLAIAFTFKGALRMMALSADETVATYSAFTGRMLACRNKVH